MKQARSTTMLAPAIAAAFFLALSAIYVTGYFLLSRTGTATTPTGMLRVHSFKYQWLADLYMPAASMETMLTGQMVTTGYYEN
jgi:hypothetical protein